MTNPLNLVDHIDRALDEFEEEREKKWRDPDAGARVNEFADQVAKLLFASATTLLTTVDQQAWRNAADTVSDDFEVRDELLEALQIMVARHFFEDPMDMALRTLELLRLTLRVEPKEQVRRFLAAAARTYILGLSAECSIMCRASVENALAERFSSAELRLPLDDKGQSPFPLKVRVALDQGWLDSSTAKSAREVWTRGSKSAHADPDLVTRGIETVAQAVEVLEALYRST